MERPKILAADSALHWRVDFANRSQYPIDFSEDGGSCFNYSIVVASDSRTANNLGRSQLIVCIDQKGNYDLFALSSARVRTCN